MTPNYTLTDAQRKAFAGIYLLEYMINKPHSFPVVLDRDDEDLEPILEWLMIKDYVSILDADRYIPTNKGREALMRFLARYVEYLNVFDTFCAVDLEAGDFAFRHYFEFDDMPSWRKFLHEERWDDLRIAVVEYKNMDPIELVFMSFINEKRFGRDQHGWQFDLLLGSVWDQILTICNTAIHCRELGYEDEDGVVSGEAVAEDILTQGADLLIELLEQNADLSKAIDHGHNGAAHAERFVEQVSLTPRAIDEYYAYRDPTYVSPNWRDPWLI